MPFERLASVDRLTKRIPSFQVATTSVPYRETLAIIRTHRTRALAPILTRSFLRWSKT